MNDFADYVAHLDLSESEASALSDRLACWQDLHRWMDDHPKPTMQPDLQRTIIVPSRLDLSVAKYLRRMVTPPPSAPGPGAREAGRGWEKVVEGRRRGALLLTLATTAALVFFSAQTLKAEGMPDAAMRMYLAIYAVMTYFLASNSYKLFLGSWHASRGARSNPWHPLWQAADPAPGVRVAIVYPVLHENVERVAAGMAATWKSIASEFPDLAVHFDNFLLSDSRRLEHWIAEETAIHELRKAFPDGRFYYRRRSRNVHAKLGNIMDFCRRWGCGYQYMLLMDADSLMDGRACTTLLRMMEGNPRLGILQTNPRPVLRRSLFGRMQQFAGRLYGSVFNYSLQTMFMGHACYIGHNAIIRMDAFMQHCILPRLSGPPPWGGKPLSHDIIESAMMARAGYEVWFLPEIEGSYEETPGNILDFLVRERRWMQGNLQHLRFILLDGLRNIHREMFFNGSMGYLSAPLWACFLVLSGYGMVHFVQSATMSRDTFGAIELPSMMLAISALVFLFMPRILAFSMYLRSDRARKFGGKDKLAWSILFETAFSFCFSAIIMIYISWFMWLWLRRRSISWNHAVRDDEVVPWAVCFRHFAWVTVVGAVCWLALQLELRGVSSSRAVLIQTLSDGWLSPETLVYGYLPVVGGFAASTIIVRVTSKTFDSIRRCRLFCIPEEIDVPPVLQDMERWREHFQQRIPDPENAVRTVDFALSSPSFYVGHRPDTRVRSRIAGTLLPKIRSRVPLTEKELLLAFGERDCFDALHQRRIRLYGDGESRAGASAAL